MQIYLRNPPLHSFNRCNNRCKTLYKYNFFKIKSIKTMYCEKKKLHACSYCTII